MKLIVNPHKIDLIKEEAVNEKEINISKCTFEFSEEFSDNLVKEAYFTLDGETYKQIIVNNECSYPPEVLVKTGTVELGVVAYEVQDEEYIERFNPSPVYFQTIIGSLKDHAENSEEITPSEMEQFEQALEEGLAEVQNIDIDATKIDNTATVSITNRDGETKIVEIYDGEKGEDGEPGITPNIQVGTTTTLPAGSNATVSQRGTTENPIFDFGIPKGEDGSGGGTGDYADLTNKPKINNVELVGNKTTSDLGIVIPDISTKQDKITTTNKLSSDLVDDSNHTNKFITTSEKTAWNAKYDKPSTGIPSTDLSSAVQTSLGKADTAIQDISGKQDALVSGTNIKTINNTSILGSGDITISSAPDVDGSSITKNSDDELQTVGVIDNNSGNTDKIWTGTLEQYNAIQNKDADTFYYITDDDATSTLRQKVEVITNSDTSYTIANLTANKSYKLGELTALTITACETFDEESVIYFDSGSTATVLSLPNDVVQIGDTTIEASKSYIISILNKIAVIKAYEVS